MSSQAKSVSEPVVAESSLSHRILIVVGFAIGAVLGFGGNFLPAGPPQNIVYAISSLGIIMGSALFAAWFARRGHSTVAAGFALLALAESISLSGLFLLASAPTFPGAYTFAAGVALYAVALPLASAPPASALDSHCRDAGGNPVCGARVAVAAGPFTCSLGTTRVNRLRAVHRRDRGLDDPGPAGRAIVTALAVLRP